MLKALKHVAVCRNQLIFLILFYVEESRTSEFSKIFREASFIRLPSLERHKMMVEVFCRSPWWLFHCVAKHKVNQRKPKTMYTSHLKSVIISRMILYMMSKIWLELGDNLEKELIFWHYLMHRRRQLNDTFLDWKKNFKIMWYKHDGYDTLRCLIRFRHNLMFASWVYTCTLGNPVIFNIRDAKPRRIPGVPHHLLFAWRILL